MKWCPKCCRAVGDPGTTVLSRYSQYWERNECWHCGTKLQLRDDPVTVLERGARTLVQETFARLFQTRLQATDHGLSRPRTPTAGPAFGKRMALSCAIIYDMLFRSSSPSTISAPKNSYKLPVYSCCLQASRSATVCDLCNSALLPGATNAVTIRVMQAVVKMGFLPTAQGVPLGDGSAGAVARGYGIPASMFEEVLDRQFYDFVLEDQTRWAVCNRCYTTFLKPRLPADLGRPPWWRRLFAAVLRSGDERGKGGAELFFAPEWGSDPFSPASPVAFPVGRGNVRIV